jgi:hypothetical protein
MNKPTDDSLDDRLRNSDPAGPGVKVSSKALPKSATSGHNPLRDWWLTTSTRVRRSLAGGVGVAAAASVVVAGTFGTMSGPLIVLAENAGPESMSARASDAIDSKMMMPYLSYEYVAGDNLSTSTGRGRVYRLDLAGTPESVLRTAAAYFGVSGEPQKSQYFDAAWPSFVVGPEDGSAPSITVGWSGTGSWWYNNPAAYPEQKCLQENRVGKGANAYIECTEYEPAITGLNPDEAETRRLASEFFTAMGVAFDPADITVMADEWSSFASVALVVNSQKTAIEWSISWSGNGELSYAQGNAVTIVDAGEFDTVSDAVAVERLADWRWFGSGPMDYQGGMWATRSSVEPSFDAVTGESGEAVETTEPAVDPTEPAVDPTEEPAPSETTEPVPSETTEPVPAETDAPVIEPTEAPIPLPTEPEMPVQTITINESKDVLLLVWDANGNAWLVPGVALTGTDSWWQTVISLVEGVIQLPEPMPIEPMPIDPMPID